MLLIVATAYSHSVTLEGSVAFIPVSILASVLSHGILTALLSNVTHTCGLSWLTSECRAVVLRREGDMFEKNGLKSAPSIKLCPSASVNTPKDIHMRTRRGAVTRHHTPGAEHNPLAELPDGIVIEVDDVLADFKRWNPFVNSGCTNLWLGALVCTKA